MKNLKIITPSYIICGYSCPIFIDHAVWENSWAHTLTSEYNRGLSRIIEYSEWMNQKSKFPKDDISRS